MSKHWYLKPFRRARPASSAWNLLKTAGQIVVFWTVFLVLVPLLLASLERRFELPPLPCFAPASIVLLGLASALGLASGFTMAVHGAGTPLPVDAPRRLVVRGPYRFVRNPMAIAGLSQAACVACLLGSWFSLLPVVTGFVVWNYGVRPIEEQDLETHFGAAYRAYCQAVRCWIPRFPGYAEDPAANSTPTMTAERE